MEIKLLKISQSIKQKDLFYIDFEVIDRKFKIKGIIYNKRTQQLNLPYFRTEKGIKYSPFLFSDKQEAHEFFLKVLEILKTATFPERLSLPSPIKKESKKEVKEEKPLISIEDGKLKVGEKKFTEIPLPKKRK